MSKSPSTPARKKTAQGASAAASAAATLKKRRAGVLMHISALPAPHGIGDLGRSAYDFADWVAACGLTYWQVLPLVPAGDGNSPYSTWTSFAGNPAFIDLLDLVNEKLLDAIDPADVPAFPLDDVDFEAMAAFKMPLLQKAAQKFLATPKHRLMPDYRKFAEANADWLDDAMIFACLKQEHQGQPWWKWAAPLRDRKPDALAAAQKRLAKQVETGKAIQFFFDMQWQRLKDYCGKRGVVLVGDIPIYVGGDSVDVWGNRKLFKLKADGSAAFVAGVPADAFSPTGQYWGNPVYDWPAHEKTGFAWWIARMKRVVSLTDIVRIDHFRGLAAYWEIPGGSPDARFGKWVKTPGHAFIKAIDKALGGLPFIAEDLGFMTDDVAELRDTYELPGMVITEFAFGGSARSAELPHNYKRNLVVYPGTHDNETLVGWWQNVAENARQHARKYLGIFEADARRAADAMLRMTLASQANTAVVALQDFMGLDNAARFNTPGTMGPQNWSWRMRPGVLGAHLTAYVRELVELYGRTAEEG